MDNSNAEVKVVRGVYTKMQGTDLVSLTTRCPSCHITEAEIGSASLILSYRYQHCSDCGQRSLITNSDRPFGTSSETEVQPLDPEKKTEHAPSPEGHEVNKTTPDAEEATPDTNETEMVTSMGEQEWREWTEERLQKEGWKLYNHSRIPDEDREHIYAVDNKTLIGQFVEWLVPAHNSQNRHMLMPVAEQRSFRNADHGYIGHPKAYYRRPPTNTNTEWFAFVSSERAKNSVPDWFKEAHDEAERKESERSAQKSPPKESTVPEPKERTPKKVRSPLSRSQFNAALYLWILVAGALFVYGWLYLWCDAFMDVENGNGFMRSPYYNWREVFTLAFSAIIGFLAFVGLPMTVDYDEFLKKRRRP